MRAEPEVPAAGKPAGGAALSLAPEGAAPVSIAAPEKPAVAAPKISSSLALVDDEEHQEETAASGKAAPPMTCPSCGHVQAKADVCESCHVVIAKFLQRQAEREKERQAAALTGSTDDNTEVEEAVAGDSAGKSSFFGKLFGKFKRG